MDLEEYYTYASKPFSKLMPEVLGPWFPADSRSLFGYFRRRFAKRHLMLLTNDDYLSGLTRLYPDLVKCDQLQAVIALDPESGVECLGISTGSIVNIANFFALLMCDPRVLTTVGDSSRERFCIHSLDSCNWTLSVTENAARVVPEAEDAWVAPVCEDRFRFAAACAKAAVDFLFLHEVGHLLCGHVDYYRVIVGQELFQEFHAGPRLKISHLLEFQADEFAAVEQLDAIYTMPEYMAEALGLSVKEPTHPLRVWALSIMFLYQLFKGAESRGDFASETHPSPSSRLYVTRARLSRILSAQTQHQRRFRDFAEAWNLARDDFARICSLVGIAVASLLEDTSEEADRFGDLDRSLTDFSEMEEIQSIRRFNRVQGAGNLQSMEFLQEMLESDLRNKDILR